MRERISFLCDDERMRAQIRSFDASGSEKIKILSFIVNIKI